ncbi:MAG TPA: hypothetical protein VKP30_00895 [Polyangiaceae bacterium]|nr:hypothetical protein [Polyangiaceae bacterium]
MTELPYGDDVLIGYTVEALFPDGTIDSAHIFEPQIDNPDGPRATTTVAAEWVPRAEAIAQGFIRGA